MEDFDKFCKILSKQKNIPYLDAEDIVQQAILETLEKMRTEEVEDLVALMWRIISCRTIDMYRKQYIPSKKANGASQRVKIVNLDDDMVTELASTFSTEMSVEQSTTLSHALLVLSSEERLILLLKVSYGYKFSDIAQMFDIPESTVKSKYYRACQQLKSRID